MSDAPRLTVLTPIAPHPPYSGGAAHISRTAAHLAAHYRVSLYALAARPEWVTWGPLAERCADLRAFAPGPPGGSPLDPPAVRRERSADLESHLRRVWAAQPPDVVQIEFTSMAHYAPLAREHGALAVCSALTIGTLAQVRRARREASPALRARRWAGALSLWRYERRALRACDLVVTLSAEDAAALRRWLPGLPVAHVPSGVELTPAAGHAADGPVLFVGSYLHPPNIEGAVWLAREVWPRVRAARPGARLVLAGRDPPPPVLALAADDIEVPGTLPDLGPLYAGASVAAAAVFWGGGVRIKILDALAAGLPLVATPAAAEGVALTHGASALIAEGAPEFAEALLGLLGNAGLRARLAAEGRALVARDHGAARSARMLAGLYEGLRAGLGRRR